MVVVTLLPDHGDASRQAIDPSGSTAFLITSHIFKLEQQLAIILVPCQNRLCCSAATDNLTVQQLC